MAFKNTLLPTATLLQSRGRLLDLSRPLVMGILNATPDSFFSGSRVTDAAALLEKAGQMIRDGAAILDIGGASTRPGAAEVGEAEELDRILPVVEAVRAAFPDSWLSIDTYRAGVAKAAVAAGADLVNDVSSGDLDGAMLQTVAALGVPYIAMHMQGSPRTMQDNPQYADVVAEVLRYLDRKAAACAAAGIADVIVDPGFGFGKTLAHNYALLNHLSAFRMLGRPVLVGISRKSIVCKALRVSPENALNGTTALHMAALQQGASILRAHDVKEAVEVAALYAQFERGAGE